MCREGCRDIPAFPAPLRNNSLLLGDTELKTMQPPGCNTSFRRTSIFSNFPPCPPIKTASGRRQGHRKAGGQKLGHRHLVGEGVAEVQSENLLQEQEVLGEQGLIQAQLLRQGGHSLLCGLLAQNQAGWLTGDEADDGKHQDGDHKQNRNHLKDPFEDVVESIQEVTPASVSSWDRTSRSRGTAERLVHGEAAPSPWTERPAKRAGGWSRMLHPPRLGPRRLGEREDAAQLALVQYMAWYT